VKNDYNYYEAEPPEKLLLGDWYVHAAKLERETCNDVLAMDAPIFRSYVHPPELGQVVDPANPKLSVF